jgi:hypothetical protein
MLHRGEWVVHGVFPRSAFDKLRKFPEIPSRYFEFRILIALDDATDGSSESETWWSMISEWELFNESAVEVAGEIAFKRTRN